MLFTHATRALRLVTAFGLATAPAFYSTGSQAQVDPANEIVLTLGTMHTACDGTKDARACIQNQLRVNTEARMGDQPGGDAIEKFRACMADEMVKGETDIYVSLFNRDETYIDSHTGELMPTVFVVNGIEAAAVKTCSPKMAP
jgi:hypothetical protein